MPVRTLAQRLWNADLTPQRVVLLGLGPQPSDCLVELCAEYGVDALVLALGQDDLASELEVDELEAEELADYIHGLGEGCLIEWLMGIPRDFVFDAEGNPQSWSKEGSRIFLTSATRLDDAAEEALRLRQAAWDLYVQRARQEQGLEAGQ